MTSAALNLRVLAMAPVLVLGPALTCAIPRVMAPLFIISAVLTIIADCWMRKSRPEASKPFLALFGAMLAFGAVSYLWTVNPDDTFSKVAQLAGIFLPMTFLMPVLGRMNEEELKRLGVYAATGLVLGVAVFLLERFSNFALYDGLRGGFTTDVIDNKQNKAIVLLAMWAYIVFAFARKTWAKIALAVFAVLLAKLTYDSPSGSAKLILATVPLFVAFLMIVPVRISAVLTFVMTSFLVIAMPFMAHQIATKTQWPTSTVLNSSMKSRVEIWDQGARRAFEKPIAGWGLDSAPLIPNRSEMSYTGKNYIHHMHPHNGAIQIWEEMGLIGVAMTCVLFFLFYTRICTLSSTKAQRYAVFMWGTVFAYTLSIWGLWQTWFMATLVFMGVMTWAGARYIETSDTTQNKTAA